MKEFDKIIGYSSIKKELEQIVDILKNREVYDNLGVTLPKGLLLYGVPGVGKSLMAQSLIEASGLKHFICRKDKPNGEFVNHIKETFDKAIEQAPAIVFLDDMDKFANGDKDHPDSEEYVTVQSCIDSIKGHEVLVLATANNLNCLPESLLRAGRFDRAINVNAPDNEDAEKIIRHYLSKKKIADDLDFKAIAGLMRDYSCAKLETVINEAGIYAGYERKANINMDHILKAIMTVIFDVPASAFEKSNIKNKNTIQAAYHEVGHALVFELLDPGSVKLISLLGKRRRKADAFIVYGIHGSDIDIYKKREIEIIGGLAGKASVEYKFGICDMGSSNDLDDVFDLVNDKITDLCTAGFSLYNCRYRESSNDLMTKQEDAIFAEVERCYHKAKELIILNKEFLEALANALLDKKILLASDIEKIRNTLLKDKFII